jgi:hypothetical protein
MGHGTTGQELAKSCSRVGLSPSDINIESAIRCGVDARLTYADLKAATKACNKDRDYGTDVILASGTLALLATQDHTRTKDVIGVPYPGKNKEQVVATYSFQDVSSDKAPQLRKIFEWNLYKAAEYSRSSAQTKWVWPETVTLELDGRDRVLDALRRLKDAPSLGVDVETPMPENYTDFIKIAQRLLNVGFGSRALNLAVSVTWPSADAAVRQAVTDLLASEIPKVMFNGQFDARVFIYNDLVLRNFAIDPMEQWRMLHPFIADATDKKGKSGKSLDYVASALTFAPGWKHEFKHATSLKLETGQDIFEYGNVEDRAIYNARDSYMQDLVGELMAKEIAEIPGYEALFAQRMRNINKGVEMSVYGLKVDERVRSYYAGYLDRATSRELDKLMALVSKYGMTQVSRKNSKNKTVTQAWRPTNPAHVGAVFTAMGVHNSKRTPGGNICWDADVMVELCSHDNKDVREFASSVLAWRAPQKLKSTYIDELPVFDDGCVHIEWSPGGTISGRWASRNPNGQNLPNFLDTLFVPRKKYVVKFDFSQLELRIVALLSQCKSLLADYAAGVDVHTRNAQMIFGKQVINKFERLFAKIFVYSANYGASLNTIYTQIVSATDPATGKAPFANMTKMQVAKAVSKWFSARPEIKAWQDSSIKFAVEHGYIVERVSGLRLVFPENKVDPSRVLNFQAQTLAGFVANNMVDALSDEIITRQIHDSLEFETDDPIALINRIRELFKREYDLDGHKMCFPGDISVSAINYGMWVGVGDTEDPAMAVAKADAQKALCDALGAIEQVERPYPTPDETDN